MSTSVARSERAILEFRQYRARRGRRDEMVRVFDTATRTALEEAGAEVLGQFTDLDQRSGWALLRAWTDYADREAGSARFYGGAAWRAHAAEFNATLADCSNVRVLVPLPDLAMVLPPPRQDVGTAESPPRILVASIWRRRHAGDLRAWARAHVLPAVAAAGVEVVGAYVSDPRPNNVPRLPVVTGESATVTFAWARDDAAAEHLVGALPQAIRELAGGPEHHRLRPTPGSWMR
jgi:hypothetical protein